MTCGTSSRMVRARGLLEVNLSQPHKNATLRERGRSARSVQKFGISGNEKEGEKLSWALRSEA